MNLHDELVTLSGIPWAIPQRPAPHNGASLTRERAHPAPPLDYLIAGCGTALTALVFCAVKPAERHWFIVPVAVCGIVAGVDVVRWLRGRLDLFDPRTLIASVALYGFFVAPLLNVYWDAFGVGDLPFWGDWRPWLGAMACLNAMGLCAFRFAHNVLFAQTGPCLQRWEINQRRPYPFFAFGVLISVAGATAFLWQLNGVSGILRAFESNPDAFAGKGWLLVFAWPTAVLSFIAVVYIVTIRQEETRGHRTLAIALLILIAAGTTHFVLVGSYGSRGSTVWALFWMFGIVHFRIRKLPNKMAVVALAFLIAFMYFYGFYKEKKSTALEILRAPSLWVNPEGYQRNLTFLLLGDLARSDSDAFILRNLVSTPDDYDYRWGLTYASGFTVLIPKNLWPDRPEVRVDAGSEALWGKATQLRSSRMYGLGGEAMLNFGPWGVVPMFAVYGALVGWYRRKLASWNGMDARMFLAPFFASILLRGLMYDSDVLLFSVITEASFIILVLSLASKRIPRVLSAK